MTAGEWIALGGMILTFAMFLYTASRNRQKDVCSDAEIKSDVKYIRSVMDEMRIDQKAMERSVGALDTRLTRCEESCKQAHRRLDEYLAARPPGRGE